MDREDQKKRCMSDQRRVQARLHNHVPERFIPKSWVLLDIDFKKGHFRSYLPISLPS